MKISFLVLIATFIFFNKTQAQEIPFLGDETILKQKRKTNISKNVINQSASTSSLTGFSGITTGIYISEILPSNDSHLPVNDKYYDLIELYNDNNFNVDLAGFYLTDDLSKINKHKFASTTGQVVIPAKGFYVLYASDLPEIGPNHLSFNLSVKGDTLKLVSSDSSSVLDQVIYPKLRNDISFGTYVYPNGIKKFFKSPTFGSTNISQTGFDGILEPPVFSQASGFYQTAFQLALSDTQGGTMYYTTDGSTPSSLTTSGYTWSAVSSYPINPGDYFETTSSRTSQSFLYSTPLNITTTPNSTQFANIPTSVETVNYLPGSGEVLEKCKIVTAVVEKAGYISSLPVTNTFFFTNTWHGSLPVLSIQLNSKNLFGIDHGIYVAGRDFLNWKQANPSESGVGFNANYYGNYHRDSDQMGYVSIFKNGQFYFGNNVKLSISGAFSRAYREKSFKIRNIGDTKYFLPLFLPSMPGFDNLESVIARNEGSNFANFYFRDGLVQEWYKGLDIEAKRWQPADVFLNGEYWGILTFRENVDDDYLANKYGFEKTDIEYGNVNEITNNSGEYPSLVNFVKTNNMTIPANFDYLSSKVDMNSLIDFIIINAYGSTWDNLISNFRYFKYRRTDGKFINKWKFLAHDLDYSIAENYLFRELKGPRGVDFFYKYIRTNAAFKTKLVNRFADLLNTHLKKERLESVIATFTTMLQNDINKQVVRWDTPVSASFWANNVQQAHTWVQNRKQIVIDSLLLEFGLTGTFNLALQTNATMGHIKVNTVEINNKTLGVGLNYNTWTGVYFDNVAIELSPKPKPGYRFKHWLNSLGQIVLTENLSITTSTDVSYTAVFEQIILSPNPLPLAKEVKNCGYNFEAWASTNAARTYPDHMRFVYFQTQDPALSTTTYDIGAFTTGAYNFTSRSRVSGQGAKGVSFINTSGPNENIGYPYGKLGGAVVALNTMGVDSLKLSFKARTITVGTQKYGLRLQYRIGDLVDFTEMSPIVDYQGAAIANDSVSFTDINLPSILMGQPYVQLLWRYYRVSGSSARDQLGIDDIYIKAKTFLGNTANQTLSVSNPHKIESKSIMTNSDISLNAAESIVLLPGFKTEPSTVFRANINGCN